MYSVPICIIKNYAGNGSLLMISEIGYAGTIRRNCYQNSVCSRTYKSIWITFLYSIISGWQIIETVITINISSCRGYWIADAVQKFNVYILNAILTSFLTAVSINIIKYSAGNAPYLTVSEVGWRWISICDGNSLWIGRYACISWHICFFNRICAVRKVYETIITITICCCS